MVIGQGSTTETLSDGQVQMLLAQALEPLPLDGKRVLVLIPDGTRTALIPLMFRLLYEQISRRVARLDYLIALGTHPPMSQQTIEKLVGVSEARQASDYPNVAVFNHRWDQADALQTIGTISPEEIGRLTSGVHCAEVAVTLNRLIFDYDQLVICGPVFPHEVAGFSGGAKYLFPGIAGAEIINFTHWLGALVTSMDTIGVKDTPVRRVIHRAAAFVQQPILLVAMTLKGSALHGLFIGHHEAAWSAASDLSALLNVRRLSLSFRSVLSIPSFMYDDLWTAAKGVYKTEPIVADGGEIIIYAPHITEVSYTHGHLIDEVGYHVRDYFVKQWKRFQHIPGGVLAHSTHVKGQGVFDEATGIETPRIQVTLATGIPAERCRRINLGYQDYRTIDPQTWANREADGLFLAQHAGETLYRSDSLVQRQSSG